MKDGVTLRQRVLASRQRAPEFLNLRGKVRASLRLV